MSRELVDLPAKPPFSVSGLLDKAWNSFAEVAFSTSWSPLTRFAENAIVTVLQKITVGQLKVSTPEREYTFPPTSNQIVNTRPELKAELRVLNDTFWMRLAAMGDLGFAEAYMYGEVECEDLISMFQIFLENKQHLENIDSMFSFIFALPKKITAYRFANSISNTRSNISAHYDISNAMFAGFLSKDMTYSSAVFENLDEDGKEKDLHNGNNGVPRTKPIGNGHHVKELHHKHGHKTGSALHVNIDGSTNDHAKPHDHASDHSESRRSEEDVLYTAQMRKLDHVIKKARIQPGHHVLEIGSGWGSMAIRITQTIPDTMVHTLTLSSQQQTLAQERIAAAGLSDRITVHLMDYRSMPPEWEGAFDRVISLGMVEEVGEEFLVTYWKVLDWALKPQTGAGVVQVTTIPEARYDEYRKGVDFLQKWTRNCNTIVFPGGLIPTLTLLLTTLQRGSKNRLVVDSVSNIGPHYGRTLREWCRRFLDRFEDVIIPALKAEHPNVMGDGCENGEKEIEVFKRKWIYYYCYSEIGFDTRRLGDHIITFAREGYQDFACDVFV